MNPGVSIIMGVYNAEKTLNNCIDSILKQTYLDWEFIICDDCSTDDTKDILDSYKMQDERIVVINNTRNLGLAASLNQCLKMARGEYIARMDADDESLPDRLNTQIDYLKNYPDIDCVGCNRIIYDDNGENRVRKSIEHPTKQILIRDTPFAHPTIMMKKNVYDDLEGYTVSKDTARAEDLDLWIRFFAKGYRGYNLQIPLYKYHETKADYKKRNLKAAVQTSRVFMKGYRIFKFPLYSYIFALKPIVSAIIPSGIMVKYKEKKEMVVK